MNAAEVKLFDAAISGRIDSLEREIDRYGALISLEHVTPSGNCILHVAAKSGRAQIMERVLHSLYPNSPLHATNCEGNTALHIAASLGNIRMTRLLIDRAVDQEAEVKRLLLKAQNVEQNTALHLAVKHGHYEIVDLLIRQESRLTSITNKAGESPLFLAVDRGFFRIAPSILDTPECSDGGRNNMNVLHAAVIRAEIDFVRDIMIKFPNAILKADDFGRTPLHYAAYFDSLEVVNLFLENSDISLAYKLDKQGMSALHMSAKKGHCHVMRAILQKFPFTCELLDNKGRTALHHAVESGSTNAVKTLLSSLAFQDLINEQENDEGNTAMHLAAIKRRYKVLILLAGDRRVDKSAANKEGKTMADIIQLDKQPTWFEIMVLRWIEIMSKQRNRGNVLLSLEHEVERQTTEEQFAENEVHEQFKESQRIEAATKDQGGTGAANNIAHFIKELKEYNFLGMTLITTVTFAAAVQMPGGYDGHGKANLIKSNSRDFRKFLICDSFSFGTSAASLLIYFATPQIPKMTSVQNIVQRVTALLNMVSLSFMILAFSAGVGAVLDEKSSLYSLINTSIGYGMVIAAYSSGIIHIFMILLIYIRNKLRPLGS